MVKKRVIDDKVIINKTRDLILSLNFNIPLDVLGAVKKCANKTRHSTEKMLLEAILKNASIAKTKKLALCQDTGISSLFLEVGNVQAGTKQPLYKLLNKAVSEAYGSGKLRPSIIDDPLKGTNTGDNTPAFINVEHTNTSILKISYLAKGGGSENATSLAMLNPSDGFDGVKDFVIKVIKEKGPNCCPPVIVGIGIGGTADKAILSSKKVLLRKIGQRNTNKYYAQKELELRQSINKLGIGAMGLGGDCTALDVFIEAIPRHIATLAVGVSVICHSTRRGSIEL